MSSKFFIALRKSSRQTFFVNDEYIGSNYNLIFTIKKVIDGEFWLWLLQNK